MEGILLLESNAFWGEGPSKFLGCFTSKGEWEEDLGIYTPPFT